MPYLLSRPCLTSARVLAWSMLALISIPALHGPTAKADDSLPEAPRLIVRGARIFDAEAGRMIGPLDIEIRGDRIEGWGTFEPGEGDEAIDASGLYALPGLFDAHTHLAELTRGGEGEPDSTLRRFVEAGILQVRDVGGPIEIMRAMRGRIEAGEIVGPEIFHSGPMLERSPLLWGARNDSLPGFTVAIDSEADADSMLQVLVSGGARCVKAFGKFDQGVFAHLVARARELGLPVVHDPGEPLFHQVPVDRSIEWGVSSIEHGKAPWPIVLREELQLEHDSLLARKPDRLERMPFVMRVAALGVESIDDAKVDALARRMVDRHVAFCPTLQVFPAMLQDSASMPSQMKTMVRAMDAISRHIVRRMADAGVAILVGQDGIDPEGTRAEMRLLEAAGVSRVEILRGATIHAARALGCESDYGSIAPAHVADIVLLEKDPLDDIRSVDSVRLVVRKGMIVPLPAR